MIDNWNSGTPYFPDILTGVGLTRLTPSIPFINTPDITTTSAGGSRIVIDTHNNTSVQTPVTTSIPVDVPCNCFHGTPKVSNGECGCVNDDIDLSNLSLDSVKQIVQQHPLASLGIVGLGIYLLLGK